MAVSRVIALPVGVTPSLENDFSMDASMAVTDAQGRFRIEGLAPQLYRIWEASPPAYVGPEWNPRPLDPDPGTEAGTEGVRCRW